MDQPTEATNLATVQAFVDEMIRDCMEDPDALSCALETLEAIPEELGACKPRILFFTTPNCSVCKEDRGKYGELLDQGKITEIDARSQEGQSIMNANNLDFTPTLAIIGCDGRLIGEFVDSNVVEGEDIQP